MRKRLLSMLLSLVMVIGLFAINLQDVSAATTLTVKTDGGDLMEKIDAARDVDPYASITSISFEPSSKLIEQDLIDLKENLTALQSLDLSNVTDITGVTNISTDNLGHYKSLKKLILPSCITGIGPFAFYENSESYNLEEIYMPGVRNIGDYAFVQCTSLASITFPNVQTIGTQAFAQCTFASISFPDLMILGQGAFTGCTNLNNIFLPASLKEITNDRNPFPRCTSLTNITIDENNIHYRIIDNEVYNYDISTLIFHIPGLPSGSLTLPPTVTKVGSYAFYGCDSLTDVDLNNASDIGSYAFFSCSSLTSVTFGVPADVGGFAFNSCTELEQIYFPATMIKLDTWGFGVAAPWLEDVKVYVPYGSEAYYKNLLGSCGFLDTNIEEGAKPVATSDQLNIDLSAKTYNAGKQSPVITPKTGVGKVTVKYNGSTEIPVNAGTYNISVDIADGESYAEANDIALGTFTINKADISKAEISISDMVWNGKQRKPSSFSFKMVQHGIGAAATHHAEAVKFGNNKNIGQGSVTLAGKNNFTGTKTVTFNIMPKSHKISKITPSKKQIKIVWTKAPKSQKIDKYEVRYRVVGTPAWKTKTYKASASKATIKNLKKTKKYEVQIRSLKKVNGIKYFSTWSPVKTSKKVK